MSRADEVLKNVAEEMQSVINAAPQPLCEVPVAPYLNREIARHIAGGKPKSSDPNDVAPDILAKIRPHLLRGEKFMEFVARIGIGPVQIRQFSPAALASFVRAREEQSKDEWRGPVTTCMPASYSQPRPHRTLIAIGGLGDDRK